MAIFSVFVVNKAGGLIYQLDSYAPRAEAEKTFSYPLDLLLKLHDDRVLVAFGQRDGIRVGHAVLAINGVDVSGKYTADGKEVLEYLGNPANYPVSIRFGRPRLTSNEKLMLASMFHSLFAIGSQLSPEQGSSGIEMLETDTFKLHCFQTLTGIKFVVLADPRQAGIDSLLRKIYEIYSDFALKNPFYSLEMPIRYVAPDAQAQWPWLTGPAAPRHVGSSQTGARTGVPCIGRQTLNHCATREALELFLNKTKV
ncbi:trafficking protein particle complex subunit 4 isoform X1 [Lagenorhynchus albirostris]|uniref:trafficking protein particle complex subunit 4 isoform X1 n=1 Tax=Lagenorhynchus albirostris TaxID=27610 RepID=UPI0028E68CC5|nr:trafficking protein particle complex subunit 4 isoform X1 [Lagenorhynchus albirostris]